MVDLVFAQYKLSHLSWYVGRNHRIHVVGTLQNPVRALPADHMNVGVWLCLSDRLEHRCGKNQIADARVLYIHDCFRFGNFPMLLDTSERVVTHDFRVFTFEGQDRSVVPLYQSLT